MRNKNRRRFYLLLGITVLVAIFIVYPVEFPCGKKIVKKTLRGVEIWDRGKTVKVAECKKKDFFQPLYTCYFDVPEREQTVVIKGRTLYVVMEMNCSNANPETLCDGSVLSVGEKKYCILYQCRNDD